MRKPLLSIVLAFSFARASVALAYYGRYSTEAELTYQTVIEFAFPEPIDLEGLNRPGPMRDAALKRVDRQVAHLQGTFQSPSFVGREFGFRGTLGERHEIRFLRVEPAPDRWRRRVTYAFRGIVVFQKEAFRGLDPREVPLKLPYAPDRIYALGMLNGKNRCTDPEPLYNGPGDFDYFWDPDQPGCPLAGNSVDVLRFRGVLRPIPNTVRTYPEYDRLYGLNDPNKKTLDIALYYGFIGHLQNYKNPKPWDWGYRDFRGATDYLEAQGFRLVERIDGFREWADGRRVHGMNMLRRYELPITYRGKPLLVRVQVLLSDTDSRSGDATFHRWAPGGFVNADLVAYDGHAGESRNLDLDHALAGVRLDPRRYQIFFFNGCHTYPYFAGMFQRAKGGSANFEIITSGSMTDAQASAPNMIGFLDNFIHGRERSYQEILAQIDAPIPPDYGPYLFGVSGDEDNVWRPELAH